MRLRFTHHLEVGRLTFFARLVANEGVLQAVPGFLVSDHGAVGDFAKSRKYDLEVLQVEWRRNPNSGAGYREAWGEEVECRKTGNKENNALMYWCNKTKQLG